MGECYSVPTCKLSPKELEPLAQMTRFRCEVRLYWVMASRVTIVLLCLGPRPSQEAGHLVQKLGQSWANQDSWSS